jgi:hypothetical protein
LSAPPPGCKPTVERRHSVASRPLSDVAVLQTRRRRRRIRVANLLQGWVAVLPAGVMAEGAAGSACMRVGIFFFLCVRVRRERVMVPKYTCQTGESEVGGN